MEGGGTIMILKTRPTLALTVLTLSAVMAAAEARAQAPPPSGAQPQPRRSLLGRLTGSNPAPAPAPAPSFAPRDPAVMPASGGTAAAAAVTGPAAAATSPGFSTGSTVTPRGPGVQVIPGGTAVPEPTMVEEVGAPTIALPTQPIEPYLLTRQNGPFMVMAHTFRGPDAVRYAQALAIELRQKYNLPAYVFFLRFQPGHSNIRGVPPTAAPEVQSGEKITGPERYRMTDESCVLVGDCKTIDDSEKVLHQVKKLHSEVLDGVPSIWSWRKGKGLTRAHLTTNPLVASEDLFSAPGSSGHGHGRGGVAMQSGQVVDPTALTAAIQSDPGLSQAQFLAPNNVKIETSTLPSARAVQTDPLLKQMNSGSYSLFKCTGANVLQVAEFSGRVSVGPDPRIENPTFLQQGPLAKAADDAESLAQAIAKCKSLDRRFQPYVFHDRTSSRVFIGPVSGPDDPALPQLRQVVNALSNELVMKQYTQLPLAPARVPVPVPGR
jgi:hypothetical protein